MKIEYQKQAAQEVNGFLSWVDTGPRLTLEQARKAVNESLYAFIRPCPVRRIIKITQKVIEITHEISFEEKV